MSTQEVVWSPSTDEELGSRKGVGHVDPQGILGVCEVRLHFTLGGRVLSVSLDSCPSSIIFHLRDLKQVI